MLNGSVSTILLSLTVATRLNGNTCIIAKLVRPQEPGTTHRWLLNVISLSTKLYLLSHDEVLADAVDATASLSPKQNERKGASSIFVNIAKNFKAGNADQNANQSVHTNRLENLKQLFSSPPFLKSSSSTVDKQDPFAIDIDDIQIDEPVVFSSPQKIDIDKRDKGKGTDRQKFLEEASTDLKPKARTADKIKAKYRKTGTWDASAAAALARDKLVERQEKLQVEDYLIPE
ncbi:hypothetical protein JHK84_027874 [Glycine max]|nr:hypothetical protein JHK86_027759 [Glycine max]KAG5151402.1 hypothetical protein JHK84_027874 [Glycine max]